MRITLISVNRWFSTRELLCPPDLLGPESQQCWGWEPWDKVPGTEQFSINIGCDFYFIYVKGIYHAPKFPLPLQQRSPRGHLWSVVEPKILLHKLRSVNKFLLLYSL